MPVERANSIPAEIGNPQFQFRQIRRFGSRVFLALTDQAVFSSAGLLTNAILARTVAVQAYGSFAIAFLILLFCAGFHNVLILEPMSVIGPSSYANELEAYVWTQLKLHILVTATLSAALVTGATIAYLLHPNPNLYVTLLTTAGALPIVLLFWMARRFNYLEQQPSKAALSSAVYLGATIGGITVLHLIGKLSPATAFLAMSAAALIGSVPFLRHVVEKHNATIGPSTREVLDENWQYGKWLLATAALYPISVQIQVFLVAGMVGLGAAGILRAVQLPSIAMMQVIAAVGTLELPALSYAFQSENTAVLKKTGSSITCVLMMVAVCYAAILMMTHEPLEHLLYGGKFRNYAWLIAAFGFAPVFSAYLTGRGITLRAARKPQFDLVMNLITAPFGLASAYYLVRIWGVSGAVASNILTTAISALVVAHYYRSAMQGAGAEARLREPDTQLRAQV